MYNFKRNIFFGFALLFLNSFIFADDRTGQSFLMPRGISENSMIELALQGYRIYHSDYDKTERPYTYPKSKSLLNIQTNYIYSSSDNSDALARYFLPGGKPFIRVKQDGGKGTVASKWLGLGRSDGDFNSKFKIHPERKIFGTILNYHQDLSRIYEGLWFSFMLPIVNAEHTLNIKEFTLGSEGEDPNIRSITSALNQWAYNFGKFSPLKISYTGLDDVLFKFGANVLKEGDVRAGIYTDFTLPVTGKPNSNFVFNHVLGSGGHLGLGIGANCELTLSDYNKHILSLIGDVRYRYLFSGIEERSFDLKQNGEWSRYLLVAKRGNATRPLPAINYLTRDLKITPRDRAEVLAAFHYNYNNLNLEAGCNLWWRNSEKVELKNPWNVDVGIFNPFALQSGDGTASTAKISQGFNDVQPDPNNMFVAIPESNLDLDSAAQKTSISHTLYLGASIDTQLLDSLWMFGAGGAYEFGRDNAAMNNLSLWFKTCFSF
ncbi:hypothetical protein KAW80_02685 [Candidatus Babeliales bacterium]|nr:hypothetical protein [Candidatus Babeliales bacterium]